MKKRQNGWHARAYKAIGRASSRTDSYLPSRRCTTELAARRNSRPCYSECDLHRIIVQGSRSDFLSRGGRSHQGTAMNDTMHELENAFIEDHQKLSRGYWNIIDAIQAGNFDKARTLAEELDRVAGPHIEFEEKYLYPEVRQSRGDDYTDNLYSEHSDTIETLIELQSVDNAPSATQTQRWLAGMQRGLDHAASCGTLLSHLDVLDPTRQKSLLEKLIELRQSGKRWSQLHASA